jgi:hypothetical protein
MKSRRMRLIEHIACMGEIRICITLCLENLKWRDHLGKLDIFGRITLEWIFVRKIVNI